MTSMNRSNLENILLVTILTFAPLALGSVHTWSYCTFAFLALILFNMHFFGNTERPTRLRQGYGGQASHGEAPCAMRHAPVFRSTEVIGALAFLVVALLYIVPLPPEAVRFLSPKTWTLWQTYTIDPPSLMTFSPCVHATVLYIVKFITYLMVFLTIVSKCNSSTDYGVRTAETTPHTVIPAKAGIQFKMGPHFRGGDSRERTTQDARRHDVQSLVPDTRYPILNSYVLLGALCAVLSILIHSLSDFNLHIPANALYFTVMLALITGLSRRSSADCGPFDFAQGPSRVGSRDGLRTLRLCSGSVLSGIEGRTAETIPHTVIPAEAGIHFEMGPRFHGGDSLRHATQDAERQSGTNSHFLSFLTHALIVIGFIVAVFGILQKLSYNGKIYWLIEKGGSHFGPYINYDHAAGFMEMCALFTIAVFIGNVASSSFAYTRRFVDKVIWFSTKEANKCLMYLFLAVVMATALFMTTSRGGIMSFIAACAVLYFACLISAESRKRKRMILATVLVIVLIVVMFSWVGPEETISRFKGLQEMIKTFIKENAILSEIRPLMWHDTLNMIKDFPITGTGLGSYSYIFSKYRTFDPSYGFLRFAHNDYLNFISEMGAVGATFLVGFFVWYVRKFRNCVRRLRKVEN